MKRVTLIVTASVLLAACAAPTTKQFNVDPQAAAAEAARQRLMVVESRLRNERRVLDIADPILKANTDLCSDKVVRRLAMRYANLSQAQKDWRPAYRRIYGLDGSDRLTVYYTAEGGPADLAGIRPGDVMLAVNGEYLVTGKKAGAKTAKLIRKALEGDAERLTLTVERTGAPLPVDVTPARYCDSPVGILNSADVNAFATGKAVFIHAGMLRFAENDDELALVIGHEISHNAMLHIEKQKKNAAAGGFFGLLLDVAAAAAGVDTGGGFSQMGAQAGVGVYSVAFEQEADYVGLYMLQRAGYDISGAPAFWRRMAAVDPAQISYSSTHPSTSERFLALEQTVGEINMKHVSRLAMLPEAKDAGSPVADPVPGAAMAAADSEAGMGLAATPETNRADRADLSVADGDGAPAARIAEANADVAAAPLAAVEPAAEGLGAEAYALVLGLYSSADRLAAGWRLIAHEHADLVADLSPRVERPAAVADEWDARIFELIAGPLDSEMAARRVCRALKARRQYCALAAYEGMPFAE